MKDKQFNPLDPTNWLNQNASGNTVAPNKRTVDEIYIDVLKTKKLNRKIAKLEYKAGFFEFRNGFVEAAGKRLIRAIELDPTIKHKYKFNGETLLLADQKTADKVFANKDVTINGIFDAKNMKPVDQSEVKRDSKKYDVPSNNQFVGAKSKFQKDLEDALNNIKPAKSKFQQQLEDAYALRDKSISEKKAVAKEVTSPTEVSPLKASRPSKNFKDIDVPERDDLFVNTFRSVDADDLFNVGMNDSFELLLLEIEAMANALEKKNVSKNFNAPVNKEATRKQVDGIRKILTDEEHDTVTKDMIKNMPNRKHAQMLNNALFDKYDKRIILSDEDIKQLLKILNA